MGKLNRTEVIRRTEEALLRMLPDRASRLMRGLTVAFWTGVTTGSQSRCRYCGRSSKKTGALVWRMICAPCVEVAHELSIEREAGTPPVHRDAVLADARRALLAIDARGDEVVRELEALLGEEPPLLEDAGFCSHCVARAPDLVCAPGVQLCHACIRLAMHALSKDRAASVASGETHGLSLRGIWTRTARALETVMGARTPRAMMEIERWFWEMHDASLERCSLCTRGRDATDVLVVFTYWDSEYADRGWEYRGRRTETLRAPRWDRGWTASERIALVLCRSCAGALATFDAERRAGTATLDPREILAQATEALRDAAQGGDVAAALEGANAGIGPFAFGERYECRVCSWSNRPVYTDRALNLCVSCIESAAEAIDR